MATDYPVFFLFSFPPMILICHSLFFFSFLALSSAVQSSSSPVLTRGSQ